MPSLFYTVAQAAETLQVSKSTVRRWGDSLSELGLLSDNASPSHPPRQYTERDVRLMAWAVLQKSIGLSRADVLELARAGIPEEDLPDIGVMRALTTEADSQRELSELATETLAVTKAVSALERIAEATETKEHLSALSHRLEAIEGRLEAVERKLDALPGILKRHW